MEYVEDQKAMSDTVYYVQEKRTHRILPFERLPM